ncbi:MAG: response regulator [Proteobacteria bacterium]|nr:response regulator [Pseudomonadota bacterium]
MTDAASTVYIVDDDRAVRLSLAALLKAHGFMREVFASAAAFLDALTADSDGCVVLDVRMPGMSGLDLQRRLAKDGVPLPVIIISGHGDIPMAVEAMRVGAVDFLEKPCPPERVLSAVRQALEDRGKPDRGLVPPAEVAERLERLTPREREVLDHLILGKINKVIARDLGISQRTVEIHRARIKEKLEAPSLADLIRMML